MIRSDDPARTQIERVLALVREVLGDDLVAVCLGGSGTLGGFQPLSDVDLVVVSGRSLTADDRRALGSSLLRISAWPPRLATDGSGARPLEVTVVARDEVRPWRYPPRVELQFGEWLRPAFEAVDSGAAPAADAAIINPDLAILVEGLRRDGLALVGPSPRVVFDPVPSADLARAMLDGLDGLVAEVGPDTTNVLLTLVRMWLTISTGDLAPKDLAAEWGIRKVGGDDRSVLERARAIYLGEARPDWRGLDKAAVQTANRLAGQVRRAAEERGITPAGSP